MAKRTGGFAGVSLCVRRVKVFDLQQVILWRLRGDRLGFWS
jgi:hypothetical protein